MRQTELTIRAKVTDLNLGLLKQTPVGLYLERGQGGYSVSVKHRAGGSVETGILEATASEASAFVDGFAEAARHIVSSF